MAVIVAALITGAWLVSTRPAAVPVSASVPSVPGAGPLVGTDGVTEGAERAADGYRGGVDGHNGRGRW